MADWHLLVGSSEEHSVFWRYIYFSERHIPPSVSGDFHLTMLHTDCSLFWSHRMFFCRLLLRKRNWQLSWSTVSTTLSSGSSDTTLRSRIIIYPLFHLLLSATEKDFKHNLSLYLISYGIFRYFLEYLRGDNHGELIALITPSQFWSLLMILLGIILIFIIKNLYQRKEK